MNYFFEDFTDEEYCKLLRLAKTNWTVISFEDDYSRNERLCLWRHDVDFSMHRAWRFAQMEAQEGIKATYYVLLHSKFYNLFEDEVFERVEKILALGHKIGLHFDLSFYAKSISDQSSMIEIAEFERDILERFFDTRVRTISFHMPDLAVGLDIDIEEQEICGMINANGREIKRHFSYCSDSNGYWRFRRLRDVLEAAVEPKLHVLTHPEMWTPEPMSPRDRVTRCIVGRMARQHQWYDDVLARTGRKNIR